jgi:hypothetical protein
MKLVDLVSYFRRGGSFEEFCGANALDAESEVIEIYAQDPVTLEAELGFFPINVAEGQVHFSLDGVAYTNLFDFFYFLDAIKEVKPMDSSSDLEVARSLLSYALNDA